MNIRINELLRLDYLVMVLDYEGLAEGYERCFESINEMLKKPEIRNQIYSRIFYVVTIK